VRILIHGINFAPELTGIGKYSGEMAAWLAGRGHEVRVVTAPPYYPQWRIAEGHANCWTADEGGEGEPRVYRCPLWVPSRPSGVKRVAHLASFALSSLPVMLGQAFWKPDVVLAIEPPLFCAPQAWLVARLAGAKSWLHIQDFEIDAAFELGILRSKPVKRLVLSFERSLLRRFDRVSTISEKMLEKLNDKGVREGGGILFPNWVDTAEIRPLKEAGAFRAMLGLAAEQCVALYSGNMGEKQGLEVVLEAAMRLEENPGIRFVLCGDGAARARLQQQYAGLRNVSWLPLQPADRLNELLNLADVHLLPQRADAADIVMPSRLLGMMASARPVLATASPSTQVGKIVARCGALSPAGDVPGFIAALQKLAGDPELRSELGAAGRLIARKHFSRETVLERFERELAKVARV
jgi:colanic acid biosynthesis glycosyl transferase WcaI